MRLSLVVSTHTARFEAVAYKGNFEQDLARVAEWGYEGVELAIRDPRLIDGEQLITLLQRYGLEVPAIGTGQAWGEEGLSFTDPDPDVRSAAVARIQQHLPLAARLGAIVVIGLIRGRTPPGFDRAWAYKQMLAAMRTCASAAQGHSVRLALEPLNRYETDLLNTAEETISFVEEVGLDNVGLLLDTFHMNIEEPDIGQSLRQCAARLFHVHVADSNRWYPGAGHLDFAMIVQTLREVGYAGWLSGEFLPMPDPDAAARACIEHLRPLLVA